MCFSCELRQGDLGIVFGRKGHRSVLSKVIQSSLKKFCVCRTRALSLYVHQRSSGFDAMHSLPLAAASDTDRMGCPYFWVPLAYGGSCRWHVRYPQISSYECDLTWISSSPEGIRGLDSQIVERGATIWDDCRFNSSQATETRREDGHTVR